MNFKYGDEVYIKETAPVNAAFHGMRCKVWNVDELHNTLTIRGYRDYSQFTLRVQPDDLETVFERDTRLGLLSKPVEPTQEEFDNLLAEIINESPASHLLSIPGVYDILSGQFNNEVLRRWEEENLDSDI